MPTPCLKARASQELQRMQCVKESVLERRGEECSTLTTRGSPGIAAAKLATAWASCRYDARLFDTSLASRAVREAAAMGDACDHLSEHDLEAEEEVHTDGATRRTTARRAHRNRHSREQQLGEGPSRGCY